MHIISINFVNLKIDDEDLKVFKIYPSKKYKTKTTLQLNCLFNYIRENLQLLHLKRLEIFNVYVFFSCLRKVGLI